MVLYSAAGNTETTHYLLTIMCCSRLLRAFTDEEESKMSQKSIATAEAQLAEMLVLLAASA